MDQLVWARLIFVGMVVYGVVRLVWSRDQAPDWTPPSWQRASRLTGDRDGYRFYAKISVALGLMLVIGSFLVPAFVK